MTENLGELLDAGAHRTLELAATWIGWDRRARVSDDGARVYTPHKVIRRYADHLVDHLAEIEAWLAGVEPRPDHWHASMVTLESDWARFTEADLNEATERITRLATTFRLRVESLAPERWDEQRADAWTVRQTVEHVAPAWYAEQLGAC